MLFEGHAYCFSEEQRSFADAQTTCTTKNGVGKLVEINSHKEMSFLMSVLLQMDSSYSREYYIGLNHPTDTKWASGESVDGSVFRWYDEEPKGTTLTRHGTTLQGKNGFMLNAYRTGSHHYVCEMPGMLHTRYTSEKKKLMLADYE